jgi:cellobiose-specific phosphotransferase system component IIA
MFFKKNSVSKHQQDSDNAFSLFSNVVKTLENSNLKIEKDIDQAQVRIDEAEKERTSLIQISKRNATLSKKINEFFKE